MSGILSVKELKNILQKYRDDDSVVLAIRSYSEEGAEAELYVARGENKRTYREFPIMKYEASVW